jgi:uncharacterized protein (DUF2249 family)
LFSAHVAKENDLLLPALVADEEMDLAGLLADMHHLTQAAQAEHAAEEAPGADPAATALSLLLDGAAELARAGQGDRACRLVASAWATLRVDRPDLAVRVTAALHRLARLVVGQPVAFRTAGDTSGDSSDTAGADPELDVRALAPAQRHQSIFAAYGALPAGAGFVLVNDHDPKPLRYQFEAEHAGEFTWDSLEAGPTVWRVACRPDGGYRRYRGRNRRSRSRGPAGARRACPGPRAPPRRDLRHLPRLAPGGRVRAGQRP